MTIWDEAKDCAMMLTDYAVRSESIEERAFARQNKILAALARGKEKPTP